MNKDKELLLLHRELDRVYDRLIDVEHDNEELRKKLEIYEWNATIEAWDEAWMDERQLALPFETPTHTH